MLSTQPFSLIAVHSLIDPFISKNVFVIGCCMLNVLIMSRCGLIPALHILPMATAWRHYNVAMVAFTIRRNSLLELSK